MVRVRGEREACKERNKRKVRAEKKKVKSSNGMVRNEVRGMRVLPLSDIKEGVTETDEGKQYMGAKNTENMT